MTAFQTSLAYASGSSVEYNEELGVYVGQIASRDGMHVIEGPDYLSVEYEMEAILREQYDQMVREAALGQDKEKSHGRSRSIGGGSSHRDDDRQEHVEGVKIHKHRAGEGPRVRAGTWVELVMGAISLSHGNFLEAGFSAMSLALNDWYDNVESLWDKKPQKKIFAVSFGGILITASSRSELRKKLIRQRNKRIQLIMNSIRTHNRERENASSTDKISADAKRLREKKKRAEILRPKYWERKIAPQGQQTGWQARTVDLRERMKGKKSRARTLWAHRL